MQATIVLEYEEEKTAKAIAEAVSPDNFKTPQGLTVNTQVIAAKIVTEILLEGKIATLIATIDDLLESVCLAEKTLLIVKKK